MVSHDRDFFQGLTNRIWDIKDKKVRIHFDDVQGYLNSFQEELSPEKNLVSEKPKQKEKKGKNEHQSQKINKKIEREIRRLEEKIETIELDIKHLEEKIQDPSKLSEKERNAIYFEHAEKSREASEMLELWEITLN